MPSRITPYLAQGSYPRDMPAVYAAFDVVVFTAEELPPPAHAVPEGKRIYHLPYGDTHDLGAVPIVDLVRLSKRLAQHIHEGKRVLVTCAMGLNRSGLLSALTLAQTYGLSGREAVGLVQLRRGPGALSNSTFAKLAERVIDGGAGDSVPVRR